MYLLKDLLSCCCGGSPCCCGGSPWAPGCIKIQVMFVNCFMLSFYKKKTQHLQPLQRSSAAASEAIWSSPAGSAPAASWGIFCLFLCPSMVTAQEQLGKPHLWQRMLTDAGPAACLSSLFKSLSSWETLDFLYPCTLRREAMSAAPHPSATHCCTWRETPLLPLPPWLAMAMHTKGQAGSGWTDKGKQCWSQNSFQWTVTTLGLRKNQETNTNLVIPSHFCQSLLLSTVF